MKQPKQKTQPVISARKAAKSELKARLLTTLKTILEQDKIKLTKKIKKQSKKLVKAVTSELVIAKEAVVKTVKPAKAAPAPKAVLKETKTKPSASVKKVVATQKATKTEPVKAKPAAKSKTEGK